MTSSEVDGPSYLGRLRRAAGLTQERLALLSELSVRTVRNLEYGSVLHPHADSLLRIASVVTASRSERQAFLAAWGISTATEASEFHEIIGAQPSHAELLALMEERMRGLDTLAMSCTGFVDASGHLTHIRNSSVVRAREDGASATYVATGPRASALSDVSLHEIDGCFLRRATTLEHADMQVFDLSFDRVLRGNEAHGFSYVLSFDHPRPNVQPQNLFGYATYSTGALCTIKTVFETQALPVALTQVYRPRIGEPIEAIRPVELDRRGQAQLVITDARPGWHGLSWDWPEPR